MKLIYIQTYWINHNVNIAHFLHDVLFHNIDFYLNNKNIKIKFILSNKYVNGKNVLLYYLLNILILIIQ